MTRKYKITAERPGFWMRTWLMLWLVSAAALAVTWVTVFGGVVNRLLAENDWLQWYLLGWTALGAAALIGLYCCWLARLPGGLKGWRLGLLLWPLFGVLWSGVENIRVARAAAEGKRGWYRGGLMAAAVLASAGLIGALAALAVTIAISEFQSLWGMVLAEHGELGWWLFDHLRWFWTRSAVVYLVSFGILATAATRSLSRAEAVPFAARRRVLQLALTLGVGWGVPLLAAGGWWAYHAVTVFRIAGRYEFAPEEPAAAPPEWQAAWRGILESAKYDPRCGRLLADILTDALPQRRVLTDEQLILRVARVYYSSSWTAIREQDAASFFATLDRLDALRGGPGRGFNEIVDIRCGVLMNFFTQWACHDRETLAEIERRCELYAGDEETRRALAAAFRDLTSMPGAFRSDQVYFTAVSARWLEWLWEMRDSDWENSLPWPVSHWEWLEVCGYFDSPMYYAMGGFGSWLSARERMQYRLKLLRLGVALECYRQRHGDYPETLAKLVPEFIAEVPAAPDGLAPLYQVEEVKELRQMGMASNYGSQILGVGLAAGKDARSWFVPVDGCRYRRTLTLDMRKGILFLRRCDFLPPEEAEESGP